MDIRIAVLQRAAELEGGRAGLAHKLHMPLRVVDYWMSGKEIPTDVFLAAWDIVFQHELDALKEAPPAGPRNGREAQSRPGKQTA